MRCTRLLAPGAENAESQPRIPASPADHRSRPTQFFLDTIPAPCRSRDGSRNAQRHLLLFDGLSANHRSAAVCSEWKCGVDTIRVLNTHQLSPKPGNRGYRGIYKINNLLVINNMPSLKSHLRHHLFPPCKFTKISFSRTQYVPTRHRTSQFRACAPFELWGHVRAKSRHRPGVPS